MQPTDTKILSRQFAIIRWAACLTLGIVHLVMNALSVWVARRNAFEVNGIELSSIWYGAALFPPGIAVVLAILIPRTHSVWKRDRLLVVLTALIVASYAHIPIMYVNGGFN